MKTKVVIPKIQRSIQQIYLSIPTETPNLIKRREKSPKKGSGGGGGCRLFLFLSLKKEENKRSDKRKDLTECFESLQNRNDEREIHSLLHFV